MTQTITLFGKRVDAEELAALGFAWEEAFAGINDHELVAACKKARRRCQFFPVPAQILAAVDEARAEPCPQRLAITEGQPPRKRWEGKIKAQMCIAQICHKCAPGQAAYVVNPEIPWPDREAVAREVLGKDFQEFEDFQAGLDNPEAQVSRAREYGQAASGPAINRLPPRAATK